MFYKGKEINDEYLINEYHEEKIYEGTNHSEYFDPEELIEFVTKCNTKETELTEKGIKHSPVQLNFYADRGDDCYDDIFEINLVWRECESEINHTRRIEQSKKIIDEDIEAAEKKRIREQAAKDKAIKNAITMIEEAGGKVTFRK